MARMAIRSIVASKQADHRRGQEGGDEVDEQPGAPEPHDREDALGNLLVADAGEPLDVLVRLLLDDVDDVVDGDDADEPARLRRPRRRRAGCSARRGAPRPPGRRSPRTECFASPMISLDLGRALGAQQPVERHGAEEAEARIDDVELGELLRQPRILAHEVDRLPDRPERRHRDEAASSSAARRIPPDSRAGAPARCARRAAGRRGPPRGPPRRDRR